MKALVLVDFQKEWADKNADDYIGGLSKLVEKTNKLIDACRSKNYKIIFTQHVELEDGPFSKNSQGVQLISENYGNTEQEKSYNYKELVLKAGWNFVPVDMKMVAYQKSLKDLLGG